MDSVLRAAAIFCFLVLMFRVAGMRSLAEVSNFEFILFLIVGEAASQAILGRDYSLTNAFLVIMTLIGFNVGLSVLKQRSPAVKRCLDGLPVVVVENGRPLKEVLDRERLDLDDVLAAARELQGLERVDQIKFAVLESTGALSIVPASGQGG